MIMRSILFGLIIWLNISNVFAVVNYRNGNYFQEFTDLIIPLKTGANLNFKRAYNSASSYEGIFGRGWGSSFEVGVSVLPNAIIIKEMGNGKNHLFVPKGSSVEKNLEESFKKLKEKSVLKDDAFTKYKNRLLLDPQALQEELAPLVKDAKAEDGEYHNESDPRLKLKIKAGQVEFLDSEGSLWNFDAKGILKSWAHPSGVKFNAQYVQGILDSLLSPQLTIQFIRTPQGAIKSIGVGTKSAKYTMDRGALTNSVDQNSASYSYEYDQGKMVKISGKEFSEEIKYSLQTGEVASVTDLNGRTTNYKFFSQTQPTAIRRAEIKTAGEVPVTYEYEERVGKIGPYLYRRMIQKGTHKQQTIFDDCCGRPLTVQDGEKKSEFTYNEKGLPLSLVEANGAVHSWTWNEKDELVKYSNPKDERTYTYDSFGPTLVVSKLMGSISLKRDQAGRIIQSTVVSADGSKKNLTFSHSPDGKMMALVNEKGQKAFLKEIGPGNWEVDDSKPSDLKAKLELLGWLQKYQELAKPPYPQQWLPTF
jgi:YD repeat-containing protein